MTEPEQAAEWIVTKDYRIEQGIALAVMGLVMILFGAAVLAQQYRRGIRPTWPMPGGIVGGAFLIGIGLLPLHMALIRFRWLPWQSTDLEATLVYGAIAVNSVATLVRWWRHGLGDRPGGWDGATERRAPRDRRRGWGKLP